MTVGLRWAVEIRTRIVWPFTYGRTWPITVTLSPVSTYLRPRALIPPRTSSLSFPGFAAGGGAGAGAGCGAGGGAGTGSSAKAGTAVPSAKAAPKSVASAALRIWGKSTRPAGQGYTADQNESRGKCGHAPAAVLVAPERNHVVEGVQTDARQDRTGGFVGHAEGEAERDQRRHGLDARGRVNRA